MPCMKCANGKYKYGEGGSCVFDTLAACKAAAAAIHIQNPDKEETMPKKPKKPIAISTPAGPHQAPSMPYKAEAMIPLPAVQVEPGCSREDMTPAMEDQYK